MKKIALILFLIFPALATLADEGMWLPQLLAALNEKDMKAKGMKISAADIYSINKSSLKDAIVSFGGFCTAEVISDQGLLLTNHHCGFDAIQNHSSLEHNYIRDGFWASTRNDELKNPGLTATFIIRIEDVTAQLLDHVTGSMTEKERQSQIDKNLQELKKSYTRESYQDVLIRSFFEGNKYFLFVTETYRDIRLVGAPPSSIGNFGKDSDNWMWPRHTGDFSMFRIYAGKDNKPADYSPDNVPYKPKRSLSISLKGLKEGDFTMVFGFPGRTQEYLPSSAVEQIMNQSDPAKIAIRERALAVMLGFMKKDEAIKIKYAAKYASVENAYKKWKGEVLGLRSTNAVGRKKMLEDSFQRLVQKNPALPASYAQLVPQLEKTYQEMAPWALARDQYSEIIPRIELFSIAAQMNTWGNAWKKQDPNRAKIQTDVSSRLEGIFEEYHAGVDEQLFASLMEIYFNQTNQDLVAPAARQLLQDHGNSCSALAQWLFMQSRLTQMAHLKEVMNATDSLAIANFLSDPALLLQKAMSEHFNKLVAPRYNELQASINQLQRNYMQAQMDVFKSRIFYPDANSTLRVTYGNVKGYKARDAVQYHFYTYLDGVMEKYQPGDYEFDVPQKLIDLYRKKDFGVYGVNGRQPVCFIAANHTTGGNSGSPALDAYGNLVGLNFDRVWEGTMSDINYNKDICRNIMVDIRYVLFIVDKFAGASHLIQEMKLIR